jgi:hypothetical protein
MPSVPRVAISGGIRPLVMNTPLTTPHPVPVAMPAAAPSAMTPQPARAPPCAAITLAATTPEKTRTDPTERSMPPVTMTKVMPTASTSGMAALMKMVRML